MRIASRDLRVVSVGLVSAVLLVGCSGNSSKPKVIPALTLSATPTAATTPAPAPSATPAATSATSPPSAPATTASSALPPTANSTASPTPASTAEQGDQTVATKMIAVVTGYYTTLNKATHDATLLPKWRAQFADSCKICLNEYDVIKKELDLGTRYVGGGYKLESLIPTSWDDRGGRLKMTYRAEAGKAYNKAGKLIDSVTTTQLRDQTVTVERQAAAWYVVFIDSPTK
ncbi:hypothetical protein acdb102_37750 [Acidothermaceae bacterium B102]|nr:hypothetical protein acdb102_37750 [Acidothermaceae bacterium B102]